MEGCKAAGLQAQVAGSNRGCGTDNKISTGGNAQPAQVLQPCLLVDFCEQQGITTTTFLCLTGQQQAHAASAHPETCHTGPGPASSALRAHLMCLQGESLHHHPWMSLSSSGSAWAY
eukprot:GHRQ01021753.1.p1 GENE.GHRQ01021753.1~~GHRQ01021753.1.p1  ORF type:complete len:117 (-),score=10.86 GHRQ01021753.1:835-1185(-)